MAKMTDQNPNSSIITLNENALKPPVCRLSDWIKTKNYLYAVYIIRETFCLNKNSNSSIYSVVQSLFSRYCFKHKPSLSIFSYINDDFQIHRLFVLYTPKCAFLFQSVVTSHETE